MNPDAPFNSILLLLLVQLLATCGMVGVIWFVQLITYPQFANHGEASFVDYHQQYSNRVTWIVGPLMLIELGTSFFGLLYLWKSPLMGLALTGFLIVVALWALTAFVQVPQHTRLSYGKDIETIKALVKGNWVRTALWSVRAGLTVILIYRFCLDSVSPK